MKKIQRICKVCGVIFYRYPSQLVKPGQGTYCSMPCKGKDTVGYMIARRKLDASLSRQFDLPIYQDSVAIPLNSGKHARVDHVDKDLAGRIWTDTRGYAIERVSRTLMHRLIMERVLGRELAGDEYVDHINMNKSDNRRSNLRLADVAQNAWNTPARRGKYKGVSWDSARGKYSVHLTVRSTKVVIGRFEDEATAAWMADQYAIALHGEFATLNFEYV